MNNKQIFSHVKVALWKTLWKQSIAHWTKINRLVPHATDVLYSLDIDITSLWCWGQASSDSRNTAKDWSELYTICGQVMLDVLHISAKSSNKYASRDNRFSGTEKRNRSQPGRRPRPNSKNARMRVSLLSPVRKDHLQRKSGTAGCFFRNEFIIQTQIHSSIYSINFGIGILAEIQSLH